jgi:hypothetical protein
MHYKDEDPPDIGKYGRQLRQILGLGSHSVRSRAHAEWSDTGSPGVAIASPLDGFRNHNPFQTEPVR